MNYYAQGGQARGLKALAQELPKYGRYGDSIVAHINPQEAGILKALGGSGTINPDTGLPEYFKIKNIFKPVQQAVAAINPFNPGSTVGSALQQVPGVKEAQNLGTQVFQPVEKAIVKPASAGLASFDKAVGKTIPGGWGTVGSVALAAMGVPVPVQVAYGAARGSGVMRKGGNFNLQGAMIGGATAYATAELGEYMRGAVPPGTESATDAAMLPVSEGATDGISSLYNSTGGFPDPSAIPSSAINSANAATAAAQNVNPATGLQYGSVIGDTFSGTIPPAPPSIGSQIMSGNFGDALSRVGTNISEGATNAYDSMANFADKAITSSTYTDALGDYGQNASKTGQGALNLLGVGEGTAKEAAALAAKTGIKALPMTAMALYGETTLSDLDAQRNFLNEQKAAGNIAQAEYDAAVAEIDRQADFARETVNKSPFSTTPDRDVSIGETFYGRTGAEDTLYGRSNPNATLYAMGGSVDDESGMDEARGLGLGNLSNGFMNMGSTPAYASGGMPRFLSGGGDGMSDDIPATINGNQPARLADGEFVIPADVVSHIGNGSSKAGAKQLYSMMNKVRKARTGNPKQGKQINPRKYMPA
jgi:hypothetical protein